MVHQRRILDSTDWSSLAGFSTRIGGLEKCTPPVFPVARQGNIGENSGGASR